MRHNRRRPQVRKDLTLLHRINELIVAEEIRLVQEGSEPEVVSLEKHWQ